MPAASEGPPPASEGPPPAAGGPAGAERRLRRDAEANRRHILEAAGRLMAERGLATPLEDIAAAAGVGIATLYRRFPTRADLVEALFQDRLAAYVADLETAVAMDDGWEALAWYLRRSAGRQIADRALGELLEHDPGPGTIRHLRDRVVPLARRLVDNAKAGGRLRPDFTVTDLAAVQHMLASVGTVTACVGEGYWARYLTILLDGMVTGRREPSDPEAPALTIEQLRVVHSSQPAVPPRSRRPQGRALPSPPTAGGGASIPRS